MLPFPQQEQRYGDEQGYDNRRPLNRSLKMPLVRINVDASTSADVRQKLSEVVYDAMTLVGKVPANDKFMIISTHAPGDLVYPKEGYLGINYTPGIVFI
jgi:hypothetical protein